MMSTMKMENKTVTTGFTLLGFSEYSHQQVLISTMVLLAFFISVLGNLGFLILMFFDHHLHKPMYFFLSNLSFLDICNTTVTLSTLLDNLFTGNTHISFSLCMTQLFLFMSFESAEFVLLTAMAYDRYVAICHPLRYAFMMDTKICSSLIVASWIAGALDALPIQVSISQFSFCSFHQINHFFCEPNVLIKLSCSDLHILEILIIIEGIVATVLPCTLTLVSYTCIIKSILKIRSTESRSKAFSTCSSHLIVVIIFYVTLTCMYMRPPSLYSPGLDKLFSLLYTVLIPMLNPIIYSLRNQEVKNAVRKVSFRKL
ncbi:olfactory receptor 8D1-like [Microcaecilia unicolor]|uniref:Olfactory receptor n=1 Tax=Microcaecilia unicolor TaxID=1415580 RepID=A0A6P7WKQ5_9AMPH|nr:olfactory receptor 8D1-like [Microcaecilia unicolor]